jgi:hypothetical protein
MDQKIPRKYSTEFRKKLASKLDNICGRNDYLLLFKIITMDIGTNYSSNRNGVFFNMNILSDDCVQNIMTFTTSKTQTMQDVIKYPHGSSSNYLNNSNYHFDEIECVANSGHKLSNQEKNIIKRIRNK